MINGKRVLAVTLARGGSKGIPRKNIKIVAGKPLINWTIDEAQKSKYIDFYYVSSDDPETLEIAANAGVRTILRPPDLATDAAKSADAILHAIDFHESRDASCEIVLELMCTNPLKSVDDIDACIEKLDSTDADSVVSVQRLYDHHPSRIKYIENDQLCDFFPETKESRRQDLTPPAYVRNGAIYVFTRDLIMKTGARYGGVTRPYIMHESVNIDEPIDLLVVGKMLEKRQ